MVNRNGTPQSPQSSIQILTIIHLALFVGVLLFGIVALTIKPEKGIILDASNVFMFVVPIMAAAAIGGGRFLYRQLLKTAIAKPTVKEKLATYQVAFIARFALLDGVSFLSIMAYLNTGNLFYLLVVGVMLTLFIILRPTKDRIFTDLNLTYDEQSDFSSLQ